jgi:hypothetical protein
MADMRKLSAWLGAATLVVVMSATAQANDILKPYVVLMLDTSESMAQQTGAGPSSCGGQDNALNHAKCAINKIVNSYGDMVFALGRFRETPGGTFTTACDLNGDVLGSGGDQCTSIGLSCQTCGCNPLSGATCTSQPGCAATMRSDARGEMLTGLVDGGNSAAAVWTDFQCGTCGGPGTPLSSEPELWGAGSWTPLGGMMQAAQRYWAGLQNASTGETIWPNTSPGFDPIRSDPSKTKFLPEGCDPAPSCVTNCCVRQCRPYINIMLTDGTESCGGDARIPLQSMLALPIDNRRYRIETKVIGFRVPVGDPDIEAYAHAGGAFNVPGVNEGYYADDEASLQLAISQILADAIQTESCNDLDDDCDDLIDEDFPTKGMECSNGQLGECRRTGVFVCRADGTGVECNAPTVTPGVEICNGLDDDCDGKIDEDPDPPAAPLDCQPCVPIGEICNGLDDDCDGKTDEGLTRQCGTGTCLGIETCVAGEYVGCTAATPVPETCNGQDDDCDGLIDGFTVECSDMNTPGGPGTDNPGHPSYPHPDPHIPENICRPGTKTCPLLATPQAGNSFGACSGEVVPCNGVTPCLDTCDGLDNDCDNKIDEDFVPADCSSNCGVGTTMCVNGNIVCNAVQAGDDTTCNGVDDDCDGNIDEDWECDDDPNCTGANCCVCGTGTTCEINRCINGQVTCVVDPAINVEVCNCEDDDCDGKIDEETNGPLCPGGATCTGCQCAFPCAPGEFPCPIGKKCENTFCVIDPCFGVTCPSVPGVAQTCVTKQDSPLEHECVSACSVANCSSPLICFEPTGECRPNDCTTFPDLCSADQACVAGTCVTNPCAGVTCETGAYCVGGACVGSCAEVTCPSGQRCRLGACETDPCGKPCPFGQACNDVTGQCIDDPCKFRNCLQGQWCNPNSGQCEDDPCVISDVECPGAGEVCRGGTCYDPDSFLPDAGNTAHVTVGGGGGCSTTGGGAGLLLALGLLLVRRRRTVGDQPSEARPGKEAGAGSHRMPSEARRIRGGAR